jgi:hypothetical protein
MGAEDDESDADAVRPAWGQLGRVVTLAAIAAASKFYLNVLNKATIVGEAHILKAALERDHEQGLLTVSNHTRCAAHIAARWFTPARRWCHDL